MNIITMYSFFPHMGVVKIFEKGGVAYLVPPVPPVAVEPCISQAPFTIEMLHTKIVTIAL